MRTSTSSRATCIWALSLALLASTTGCAQLMKSGTDLIAAGPYGAQGGAPDRVAAKPSAHRRPDTGMTSAYRVAPTRWMTRGIGEPHSIIRGLFEGPQQAVACQVVPRGLTQVLALPSTSIASPLFDMSPFEFGFAVNGVLLQDVFTVDSDALADRAFRSGALLGSRGAKCRDSIFLFVRLGSGASQPVSVLR